MIAEEILNLVQTKIIGREVFVYPELTSTNDLALEFGKADHPEGVVILAEKQTAGRGRLGRVWQSSAEHSLCFSILLRPTWTDFSRISLSVAVALARALELLTSHPIGIKWPNDIYISGKKIAGILCESGHGFVVVGIGLNISQQMDDFPQELEDRAGSLMMFSPHDVSPVKVIASILTELDQIYRSLPESFPEIISECARRSILFDRKVTVEMGARKISGTVTGLDPSGGLELLLPDGEKISIYSGEVTQLSY